MSRLLFFKAPELRGIVFISNGKGVVAEGDTGFVGEVIVVDLNTVANKDEGVCLADVVRGEPAATK